jgi:transcriptional regulator with XRE-family HTH domain
MTMGLTIKTIRQCEGISQVAFAKKLGISKRTLCDVEKDRVAVSLARAIRWAKILGYSEQQFAELSLQQQINLAGLDKFSVSLSVTEKRRGRDARKTASRKTPRPKADARKSA